MKTKYTKVLISERLPEDDGWYFTSHGGHDYIVDLKEFQDDNGNNVDYLSYWLEETKDYSDEIIEMLRLLVNQHDLGNEIGQYDKAREYLNKLKK